MLSEQIPLPELHSGATYFHGNNEYICVKSISDAKIRLAEETGDSPVKKEESSRGALGYINLL